MLLSLSLCALTLLPPAAEVGPAPAPPTPFLQDEEPMNEWTGSVSIGITKTSGNSETFTANANVDAERRGEKDRYTVKGWWNMAQQEDNTGDTVVTNRRLGGNLGYDYFVSEKMYYLGIAGAEQDYKAELDLRYYVGAGVGYQFREDKKLKINGEAALTYFDEDYNSAHDASDTEYVALRLASSLGYTHSERLAFEQTAEAFPSLEDSDDVFARVDNRVNYKLTENMFAQFQWVLAWDNTPARNAERTDHLFALNVGWTF